MSKRYVECAEDQANFSACLLKLLSMPMSLLKRLREKRGRIKRDLGIRSVVIYTLCSTVLGRIAHVPCPRKLGEAVRRVQTMLVGGVSKKRRAGLKSSGKGDPKSETRDRACAYIERFILDYFAGDFSTACDCELDSSTVRSEIREGDGLLQDLIETVEDSPSLRHILPISIISFVIVLVDLMRTGDLTCVEGIAGKHVQEFRCYSLLQTLEKIAFVALKPLHPCSGVLASGDGRPQFPPSSAYGRDGEIVKVALSNTALSSGLCMAAHMRKDESSRNERKRGGLDVDFSVETLFPLTMHAILSRNEDPREYDSILEEVEDFLTGAPTDSLVGKTNSTVFLKSYETLQKCNRISVSNFRGPGVVFRSKHIPDVVSARHVDKYQGLSPVSNIVMRELENDVRDFRRTRDYFLDNERAKVGANSSESEWVTCPISREMLHFFYHCVRLAEKLNDRIWDGEHDHCGDKDGVDKFLRTTFRHFLMGLFSCDLSGNMTDLYEDYIFSALKRHFDEREGVVGNLKAASKRRNVVRRSRRGTHSGAVTLHEEGGDEEAAYVEVEEDWGP